VLTNNANNVETNAPDIPSEQYDQMVPAMPAPPTGNVYASEQCHIGRLIVEILFYISIVCRAFGEQLGVLKIVGLSGAIITLSGLVSLGIIIVKREKIPFSFYFALGITLWGILSEMYVTNSLSLTGTSKDLLFWTSYLLMACYFVRDDKAAHRMGFFLVGCILLALKVGYIETYDVTERLSVIGVGGPLVGPNTIGPLAATATGCLLFFSLIAAKKFKLLYWIAALLSAYIAARTLSRLAFAILFYGVFVFCLTSIFTKGGRLGFIILIVLTLFIAGRYTYEVGQLTRSFESRFQEGAARLPGYTDLHSYIKRTLILGIGREAILERLSFPHVTFFYIHFVYGGISAWIYLLWLVWLSVRCWRALWSNEINLRHKLEMLAIYGMFLGPQLASVFAPEAYGVLFVTALLDRYTSPFSNQNVRTRKSVLGNFLEEDYNFRYEETELNLK